MTLQLTAPKTITIPVGPLTSKQIRSVVGTKCFVFSLSPTTGSAKFWQTTYWTRARNGYPRNQNHAAIPSYAVVSDSMVTIHHAIHPTIVRRAPTGMRFAIDGNGLHLIRVSDGMDYHPTFAEWRAKNFVALVRKGMAENYARRMTAKKTEKLALANKKQAERSTTRVTLADSRRAGNCVEGSLAFAEKKLKVSREEIIAGSYLLSFPATRLLRIANGDKPRVEAAVKQAWLRETLVSI